MAKPGRNDACPCGSGMKYKHCCMLREQAAVPVGQSRAATPNPPVTALLNAALEHHQAGRLQQAEDSYRQILRQSPDHADVHNNLGAALFSMGRLDESIASYRQALASRPGYAEANKNLADALAAQGNVNEAEICYRSAVAANSGYAEAHRNLGGMLYNAGRRNEALACYQQALATAPDDGIALHMVAALTGRHVEHAPGQYVESMFDGYAEKFDSHLAESLKYDIPQQMVALIREFSATLADNTGEKWNVIDLGCGTGLVGAAIAPNAKSLVGVDLSAKMLEKARLKNVYSHLVKSDLVSMMQRELALNVDVITCADVFIYVGKMDEVVAEARRLLREGGVFSFSIEDLASMGLPPSGNNSLREFTLTPTGRFAHTPAYVERLAAANGFRVLAMRPTAIRIEKGVPVEGWLALWQTATENN